MNLLTREKLQTFLQDRLDAETVQQLMSLAEPCLRVSTHGTWSPAESRLGGSPLLTSDIGWPEWRGRPLSFLAQFRLEDLRRFTDLFRGDGLLLFFYDADEQESWGFDPGDRGAWRVIRVDDLPAATERSAPDRAVTFPARGAHVAEELTLPDPSEEPFLDIFNPDRRSYAELDPARELFDVAAFRVSELRGEPIHQILGWPTVIQNSMQLEVQLVSHGIYVGGPEGYEDPRVEVLAEGAREWRLLLQLDSDDDVGWMWGDAGCLYFWMRDADLRSGRYDSSWCILQCY
jgi:uncharacterized protein YwqG